jgi:O-antigen/teichoic acid export membrane protein
LILPAVTTNDNSQCQVKELKKYAAWNLFGTILPGIVAIPAIGYLAKALSAELLGALTVVWALIGYLSILDLGVGRAVTRYVAKAGHDGEEIGNTIGTAVCVVLITGTVAALLMGVSAPWLASELLRVSDPVRDEVTFALRLAAVTLPLVVTTAVLQGHIEGLEQFEALNIQRAVSGTAMAVAPTLGVLFGATLTNAVIGLFIARTFAFALALGGSVRACGLGSWRIRGAKARELIHFGGWLTVTNVVGSAMNYIDRLWLSHAHGAAMVAFYSVPSELILRLSMLPTAISRSLFPRMVSNTREESAISRRGRLAIAAISGPVCVVLMVIAPHLLRAWVGDAYALRATTPLRILLIGFLCSAVAQIPFTRLQAYGLSALTARLHLLEFVLYVALLWFLISRFGATGAALAWTVRAATDWICLETLARWKFDDPPRIVGRNSYEGSSEVLQASRDGRARVPWRA